jgi:hypothetical protein
MVGITELMPNSDYFLDHLCNAILEPEAMVIDNW